MAARLVLKARNPLFAVLVFSVAGCAGFEKTEGATGPIAWRTTNFAVRASPVGVPQEGREQEYQELQTLDLLLTNTGGKTLTVTKFQRTVYAPGLAPGGGGVTGRWTLKPGATWTIPFSSGVVCAHTHGCLNEGGTQNLWRIVVTAEDDDHRPLLIQFNIAPPAQALKRRETHPTATPP